MSGSAVGFSGSLTGSTLPPPRTRIFKIIVIGDSGVGKTCLTYRFCAGKFPEKTEATIGVDFRERLVEIDSEKIKVCTDVTGHCMKTSVDTVQMQMLSLWFPVS
uniref:RAB33B, member RAS oncogene family a n=1 Tax=Seriola lalandi dorsalis TaxID=1841481 RepID=A0A3B4WZ23_SERLL